MSDELVVATGISKSYRRLDTTWSRLRAALSAGEAAPDTFVALHPTDLTVRRGESLGIVGRNGSGKSTLLSIIAGVLIPTTGMVELRGRVAALLELGSGFEPEFTGRENAFFNGALHGLSRSEMKQRFPKIEAFAEVGHFIDRPVKTYSSGMFVRLAFAVAVHIDPDILIVDESLSVGDIFFQQKCFDRLREMRTSGTSLLFVSHDGSAVQRFCDRAILLDGGKVVIEDVPRVVIDAYETRALRDERPSELDNEQIVATALASVATSEMASEPSSEAGDIEATETGRKYFETHLVSDAEIESWSATVLADGTPTVVIVGAQPFTLRVTITTRIPHEDLHVGFKLRDRLGVVVYESNTFCLRTPIGATSAGESVTIDFMVATSLAPGDYSFTIGAANGGFGDGLFERALLYVPEAAALRVLRDNEGPIWSGIVDLNPRVSISRVAEIRH